MSANEEYREFVKASPGYCVANGFAPLPPDTTWTNGEIKQQLRARSIYDEFTEIEGLLRTAAGTLSLDEAHDAIRSAAGKVLALKERACATNPDRRGVVKRWRALVCDRKTGALIMHQLVEAVTLREAEKVAIAKATLSDRGNPVEMEVRELNELCPACGQEKGGES